MPVATVHAQPQVSEVVAGQASVATEGSLTTITASDNAIIEYHSFGIGANETVQFIQPGADARVLNRVTGGDPSVFEGTLIANGQVYFVNPAGVYFTQGSLVNVGSIYAAAGSISNEDFLSGIDRFTALAGSVENLGTIEARAVHLLGQSVANYGNIVAPEGTVTMISGDEALIGERNGVVFARVSGEGLGEGGVTQDGTVDAAGGRALFGVGDTYSIALGRSSYTRAASIETQTGANGAVVVEGTIRASAGDTGGNIDLLGDKVGLWGATVDASGDSGGGTVRIGGDLSGAEGTQRAKQTYIDSASSVTADATGVGDGGTIILWADQLTTAQGDLSARGGTGGGDGGFIETSTGGELRIGIVPDTSAPAGEAGTWLIDPVNLTIVAGNGLVDAQQVPAGTFETVGVPPFEAQVGVDLIEAALAGGGNVIVRTTDPGGSTADGNITLATDLDFDGSDSASLTLEAIGSIILNGTITDSDLTSSAGNTLVTDTLDLVLDAFFAPVGAGDRDPITINQIISLAGGTLTAEGTTFTANADIAASQMNLDFTGDVAINNTSAVSFGSLSADDLQVSGSSIAFASGAILTGNATLTGSTSLGGTLLADAVTVNGNLSTTADASVLTNNGAIIITGDAGGPNNLTLNAGTGTVTTNTVGSVSSVASLTAAGSTIALGSVSSTGTITATATGTLEVGSLGAGGQINLTGSSIDIQGDVTTSFAGLTANSTTTTIADSVTTAGDVSFTGNLVLAEAFAGSITTNGGDLTVSGSIEGTTGGIGETLGVALAGGSGSRELIAGDVGGAGGLASATGLTDVTVTGASTAALGSTRLTGDFALTSDTSATITNLADAAGLTVSSGTVALNGGFDASGNATLTGATSVSVTGSSSAGGTLTVNGPLTLSGVGPLTLNGAVVDLDAVTLTAATELQSDGLLTIGGGSTAGNTLTLTADDVNIAGSFTAGLLGGLTIQTNAAGDAIALGDVTPPAGSLAIDNAELTNLGSAFSSYTFGRAGGTHAFSIGNTGFGVDTTLRGGSATLGNVLVTGAGLLAIDTTTTSLAGATINATGALSFGGSIDSLTGTNTLSSGSAFTLTQDIDGPGSLAITAPTVTLDGIVGGTTALAGLTVNATTGNASLGGIGTGSASGMAAGAVVSVTSTLGDVNLTGTTYNALQQTYTGSTINLNGGAATTVDSNGQSLTFAGSLSLGAGADTTLRTGGGTLSTGAIDALASNSLSVDAGAATVGFGALGAGGQLGSVDLTAGTLALTSADVAGSISLTADGITITNVVSSTSGPVSLTTDELSLTGLGTINGAGNLTIRQRDNATRLVLNSTGASLTDLDLSAAELALIGGGFSSLTLGSSTSTAGVFHDAGLFTFAGDLTIEGGIGGLSLLGDISSTGGGLTINGPIALAEGASSTLTAGGGALSVSGPIFGTTGGASESLTLAALNNIAAGAVSGEIGGAADATGLTTLLVNGAQNIDVGSLALAGNFGTIGANADILTVTGAAQAGSFSLTADQIDLDSGFVSGGTTTLNATTALRIDAASSSVGNVTLSGPTTIGGTLTTSAGDTTFNGNTTLANGAAINAAGGLLSVNASLDSGANGMTLTANDLAFGVGSSISGAGALLLQPSLNTTSIGIGNFAVGGFNLSSAELASITDGFSLITIGRSTGTHAIDLRSATFNDDLLIRTTGAGSLTQSGSLSLLGGSGVTLESPVLSLGGSITTVGGGVSLTGPATLSGNLSVVTSGGAIAAGAFDGASDLSLDAGAGDITLGDVGQSVALGTLTVSGDDITLTNARTTLAQTYTGATRIGLGGTYETTGLGTITATGPIEIASTTTVRTSDAIATFDGAVTGGSSLTVEVGNAEALFTDTVNIQSLTTAAQTTDLASSLTTTADASITGDLLVQGASVLNIGGDLTVSAALTGTSAAGNETATITTGGSAIFGSIEGVNGGASSSGLTDVTFLPGSGLVRVGSVAITGELSGGSAATEFDFTGLASAGSFDLTGNALTFDAGFASAGDVQFNQVGGALTIGAPSSAGGAFRTLGNGAVSAGDLNADSIDSAGSVLSYGMLTTAGDAAFGQATSLMLNGLANIGGAFTTTGAGSVNAGNLQADSIASAGSALSYGALTTTGDMVFTPTTSLTLSGLADSGGVFRATSSGTIGVADVMADSIDASGTTLAFGATTTTGAMDFDASASLTLSGAANAGGAFRKIGLGSLNAGNITADSITASGSNLGFGTLVAANGIGFSPTGSLAITGTTTAGGAVDVTSGTDASFSGMITAMSVDIDAATTSVASVSTTGSQNYAGPLTLAGDLEIGNAGTLSLGGDITLAGNSSIQLLSPGAAFTQTDAINGPFALAISAGSIDLSGIIGGTSPLSSLTLNTPGGLNLSGEITSTGPIAATAGNTGLSGRIVTPGAFTLDSPGGVFMLAGLDLSQLTGSFATIGGGDILLQTDITMPGDLTLGGPITLSGADRMLSANRVTLGQGVVNDGSARALELIGTTEASISGGAGTAGDELAQLTATAPTIMLGGDIFTLGTAIFNGATRLTSDTLVLAGDTIDFESTIDSMAGAGPFGLTLITDLTETGVLGVAPGQTFPEISEIRLGGSVGASDQLQFLRLNFDPSRSIDGHIDIPAVPTIVGLDGNLTTNNSGTLRISVVDDFSMGRNEKFAVLGTLEVVGTSARLGDISALNNVTIATGSAVLLLREAGPVLAFPDPILMDPVLDEDLGADIVAGGTISLPAATSELGPGESFTFASGSEPALGGGATGFTVRLFNDFDPRFIQSGGRALDLRSQGATNSNVAEALAALSPRTDQIGDVPQDTAVGQAQREELERLGIYARDLGPEQLVEFLVGRALYEDAYARNVANLPEVSVNRLSPDLVGDTLRAYRSLFAAADIDPETGLAIGPSGADRITEQLRTALADYEGDTTPGRFDPDAFWEFVSDSRAHADAANSIRSMGEFFDSLALLGLSGFEYETARSVLLSEVRPGAALNPRVLQAVIEASGQPTTGDAAGTVSVVPNIGTSPEDDDA